MDQVDTNAAKLSANDPPPLPGEATSWAPGESAPSPVGSSLDDLVRPPKGLQEGLVDISKRKGAADEQIYQRMANTTDEDQKRLRDAYDKTGIQPGEFKKWNADEEMAKRRTDPIEAFGSFGSVFGILASAFTHAPMENAMNASAAAMNAIKAGDEAGYDKAYKAWQDNTKVALERHQMEHQAFQDASVLMKTNLEAGLNMARLNAARFDNKKEQYLLENGMIKEWFDYQAAKQKAGLALAETMPKIEEVNGRRADLISRGYDSKQPGSEKSIEAYRDWSKYWHDVDKGYGAMSLAKQEATEVARKTAQYESEGIPHDQAFAKARAEIKQVTKNPQQLALQKFVEETREKEGREPTSEEITEFSKKTKGGIALDDATLESMAEQAIAGDNSVFTNLGRGAQGAENVIKLRKRIADKLRDQGKTGAEQAINQAQYQGLRSAERTAGTREATVGIAAYEAKNMMLIAREASAKVDRTKFVPLNQAIQALERGTSNPELAKFVAANNSLVNGYVRAISPTGVPTDIVRKHAWDMLNTAQSKQAYNAVLDTMESEMNAAIVAPEQMKQQLLKRGAVPGETDFKNLGTSKTNSLTSPGWSIEKID